MVVAGGSYMQTSGPSASLQESRLAYLDVFKGIAIIVVCMGHMITYGSGEPEAASAYSLSELLYTGLLMFIVVSGYFHKVGRSLKENLVRRLLPMLAIIIVGTVVLTLIMYVYLLALGYDLSGCDVWSDIANAIIGRQSFVKAPGTPEVLGPYDVTFQFYYIQALIVGYAIFYPIVDRVVIDAKRTLAAILVLMGITMVYVEFIDIQLPFYIQLGPMVAAFLLMGAYMRTKDFFDTIKDWYHDKRYWLFFLACLAISLTLTYYFPTRKGFCYTIFGYYGGWSVITFTIISVTGGMVLLMLCAWIAKLGPIGKVMESCGRNCLYVFVLHVFVGCLIIAPFYPLTGEVWFPITDEWVSILVAVATIAIIMVVFGPVKDHIVSYRNHGGSR